MSCTEERLVKFLQCHASVNSLTKVVFTFWLIADQVVWEVYYELHFLVDLWPILRWHRCNNWVILLRWLSYKMEYKTSTFLPVCNGLILVGILVLDGAFYLPSLLIISTTKFSGKKVPSSEPKSGRNQCSSQTMIRFRQLQDAAPTQSIHGVNDSLACSGSIWIWASASHCNSGVTWSLAMDEGRHMRSSSDHTAGNRLPAYSVEHAVHSF